MTTFRGDSEWLGVWTIFFWGWFIGYGPMMAIFISTISRGRTIRELILTIAVIAPIVTAFWFTVVVGSGIFYELATAGIISDALDSGFGRLLFYRELTCFLYLFELIFPTFS